MIRLDGLSREDSEQVFVMRDGLMRGGARRVDEVDGATVPEGSAV